MGTISISKILVDVSGSLHDQSFSSWTTWEIIEWINAGLREIVQLKPDASVTVTNVELAAGALQVEPSDCVGAFRLTRNMGDGSTPGKVIQHMDKVTLQKQDPNWMAAANGSEVFAYVTDPDKPGYFYVYPPVPGDHVEASYSVYPAAVGNGDVWPLDDIYVNAITDYVLFRAYTRDGDNPANLTMGMGAYQHFKTALGITDQQEAKTYASD